MECGAALGIVRGPDFSSMRTNDGPADGEPKAHALHFCGEERLEDALYFFLRNAATPITDGYTHRAVVQFASDAQPALRRLAICHRFAGIEHQVKQDLLKLDAVAGDGGCCASPFFKNRRRR